MIPILYEATETNFNNNGVGLLVDSISCQVTEEKNGAYELELTYPISGLHFSKLEDGVIIKAKANETSESQLFSIYNHSKPIGGVCTFFGEHISYKLNGLPVKSFNVAGVTPLSGMNTMLNAAAELTEHNFTAWSDIAEVGATGTDVPCSVRACLGGNDNSFLNVWGGEFEFNNFLIKLHASRGKKTDVVIEYGKNLTDAKQERNIAAVYTGVLPYARYTPEAEEGSDEEPEEIIVTLPENIIYCDNPNRYGMPRVEPKDFTDEYEDDEVINVKTLREKATNYVNSGIDRPSVNITASFIQLWQTTDYKDIAPLERVSLCDTVTVRFIKLGIDAEAQIIKTVFDSIQERYISVEIGDAQGNFSDTINNTKQEIEAIKDAAKKESSAAQKRLEQAIKNATELITGHKGGYVVFNPAERPQEILIMDTPDIKTATRVWRWNSAGLGYSSTGYAGEYALAMTMDGAIVADFITAGTLNGSLIQAGTVSAEAISLLFKQALSEEIDDDVAKSAESLTQAFEAADGQLRSEINLTRTYADTAAKNAEDAANAATDEKLTTYATTVEMNSAIDVLEDRISLVVSQTADGEEINTASIIAAINDDQSTITLNANKINLTAYPKTSELGLSVTNSYGGNDKKSRVYLTCDGETVDYATISLTGVVSFTDLEEAGSTVINGANITTGTIEADRIATEELACTKLYAKNNYSGYTARLNGNFGDFGIFNSLASDSDYSNDTTCLFGIYNSVPNVNFYVYGHNFMGLDVTDDTLWAKGEWDFSVATVKGLSTSGLVAVFG